MKVATHTIRNKNIVTAKLACFLIERALGHLKINRAIATRYDQLADTFLGGLYLASTRY
jgi:transposase